MGIWLWMSVFARAQTDIVDASPPLVPPDPETLLHLARERLRHGDYDGVRVVADQALALEGEHQRTAQYLVAMSYEYGGKPEEALAIYDALEAAYPEREIPDDIRFRRAECLGRLSRYDEAREELAALPAGRRPPLDQLKIDVLLGIWEIALGKHKKGIKRLDKALERAEPSVGSYYQALGRDALLDQALAAAKELRFDGSDKQKKSALQERAALIEVGNNQLIAIIETDEAAFALDGLLALGRAHADIARDMLNESPVAGLTEAQQAIYRETLAQHVEGIFVKATLYYDRAIELAAKMDWTEEPLPTIQRERQALIDEIDRGP